MSQLCPKCQSPDWKSAKLVVLEGTTITRPELHGLREEADRMHSINDRILLGDNWFSYEPKDYSNEVFATTTAFVDEIKQVMVRESLNYKLPLPPDEPRVPPALKLEIQKAPKIEDYAGKDPALSNEPLPPKKLSSLDDDVGPFVAKSWMKNFTDKMLESLIVLFALYFVFMFLFPRITQEHNLRVLITTEFIQPSDYEREFNKFLELKGFNASTISEGMSDVLREQFPKEMSGMTNLGIRAENLEPYYYFNLRKRFGEFFALFDSIEFGNTFYQLLSMILSIFPILFVRMIFYIPICGNVEIKRKNSYESFVEESKKKREKLINEYQIKLDEYKSKMKERENKIIAYEEKKIEFEKILADFKSSERLAQKNFEEESSIREIKIKSLREKYEADYANYEAELAILKCFRKELWERARVCNRCGTAYMTIRSIVNPSST